MYRTIRIPLERNIELPKNLLFSHLLLTSSTMCYYRKKNSTVNILFLNITSPFGYFYPPHLIASKILQFYIEGKLLGELKMKHWHVSLHTCTCIYSYMAANTFVNAFRCLRSLITFLIVKIEKT